VPISHRLLADRIARHTTVFGARLADCRRIYSDMPITTSLGFQFLLATLWRGGTYFLPGDSFAEHAHREWSNTGPNVCWRRRAGSSC
jgi:hypothetical protein